MTAMRVDRRWLLAGALVLVPLRRAAALTIEPASPDVTALLNARCEPASLHERLVRDLLARFAALGNEEAQAQVRAMACPICGCSLAAALPEPATKP